MRKLLRLRQLPVETGITDEQSGAEGRSRPSGWSREARQALTAGDIPLARSRAMPARQLNAAWGLWDDRPEHVLTEIDRQSGTTTFVAKSSDAAPQSANAQLNEKYSQASELLRQARLAMDARKLSEAQQLAEQAAQ